MPTATIVETLITDGVLRGQRNRDISEKVGDGSVTDEV